MDTAVVLRPGTQWREATRAFLTAKESRTGSVRTRQAYASVLRMFFNVTRCTPDKVQPAQVFDFAYAPCALSLKPPSRATIKARLATVSSYYKFIIRMGLADRNPTDALDRPRQETPTPRGLSQEEIQKLFTAIPDSQTGLRDRAIILMGLLTGRRRIEMMRLRRGDLTFGGSGMFYTYRGKGGVVKTRELPAPCLIAIEKAIQARGRDLNQMHPDEGLFGVCDHTFYVSLQRRLRQAGLSHTGVHFLRLTAAKLRRQTGATLEEVSRFLDHQNLAVTSTYLSRLEGEEDAGWRAVAEVLSGVTPEGEEGTPSLNSQ